MHEGFKVDWRVATGTSASSKRCSEDMWRENLIIKNGLVVEADT